MATHGNPLIDDGLVDFLLYSVLDAESLCDLEAYRQHSKETFDLYLDSLRRFARQDLLPTYKPMDEELPVFRDGRIHTHPALPGLYEQMIELGVLTATRPESVGGQRMPMLVHTMAAAYLMAANLSAYSYVGLTVGAAHLIEAFGTDELKERFMTKMYEGEWTGTMALTEPQAGSSLGDIATRATPTDDGYYLIKGSKIFISGADHGISENVVNLALARIDGAPGGTKGISLFAIPRLRREGGRLVSNDVTVAGMIHKIGWRGLPSLALEFGDEDDCRGWLVGEPNQGLRYMFQMMNEARIMIGVNATATASAAYHEARAYALSRWRSLSTPTFGACCFGRKPSSKEASRCSERSRATRMSHNMEHPKKSENGRSSCSTYSPQSPKRSPPSAASRPTRSRSRSTAATGIRASICPKHTCAIRSSTHFTKVRTGSKAWTCSAER
jgi:butyryl-CoA dehydrogenase